MNLQTSYDRILWILIDVILAAIIISFTLRLLRLIKRQEADNASEEAMRWTIMFDQLIKENGGSIAVKETFRTILNDLEKLTKLKLSKGLTAMELVNKLCAKFPDKIGGRLIKLYEIYEPVRFGGRRPDKDDVREFRSKLSELEKLFREVMGESR